MSSQVLLATPDMAKHISALVHASFQSLSAADWDPTSGQLFLQESNPQPIAAAIEVAIFAAVATRDQQLVGFILMRKPTSLDMLFVHPEHLRQGYARQLWETARTHIETVFPAVTTVELNATPYALPAYQALGFFPISQAFTLGGAQATRMACWLPARGLNSTLA